MRARLLTVLVVVASPLLVWVATAGATVEMQNEAKALGYPVKNCIYCHASPHAAEKMKETARELHISNGNCLLCHGANIPAALNHRGQWLVDEKTRRGADEEDMAWLKDYVEPPPEEESGADADKE
jgi:hypothetical protein